MSTPRPARRGGTLAIDHGARHTGFAFADELGITITPLERFIGDGLGLELTERVARLCSERDVARIVIGLPLDADGGENARCAEVRRFAALLAGQLPDFPQHFVDEHLSSKAAEERLREAGRSGRAHRAERDSWSALVLLEDYLRR